MGICSGVGLCSGGLPDFAALSDGERLKLLNNQIRYAINKSSFYRERLKSFQPLLTLNELGKLPFTTRDDLVLCGKKMVCVGASDIKRIVTMRSSGTTGMPKRLYFTSGDLERTVKFFADGMSWMCKKGERVGIFMPCEAPEGIGQLLASGLERIGAVPVKCGSIASVPETIKNCKSLDVMVGFPGQLRMLSICAPELKPKVVLLSGDYVSISAHNTIEKNWGCKVFNHFGMTESGLGCAVECPRRSGMFIRRDEVILEIIDEYGKVLPYGEQGEIVLTTLKREAMPIIRYRTGDKGRLISDGTCCVSPRLSHVYGRISDNRVSMPELEEILFAIDWIIDFKAEYSENHLHIKALTVPDDGYTTSDIIKVLNKFNNKCYITCEIIKVKSENVSSFYVGKRIINEIGQ